MQSFERYLKSYKPVKKAAAGVDQRVSESDEYIKVDHIGRNNYEKYVGKKVNVRDYVDLSDLDLKEIPITFGEVGGRFNCQNNRLVSLKGCPHKVGDFYCYNNSLVSLHGCPAEVGGDFSCYDNELTSLEGCPSEVSGDFDCSNNKLTSLEGCPRKVGQNFDCLRNKKKFTLSDVKRYCKVHGKIYCD